jgi:DNA mismatch repair protein MutL
VTGFGRIEIRYKNKENSPMPIHVLPPIVAAQIAAGEVVERPASVVKELVENALDAGATQILIEVMGSGTQLIRISDNGAGIPADEITLALERHATSKIATVDDIYQVETLGFRGEALHSIAAVSRLTLTSRQRETEMGARISAEGGNVRDVRGVGVPAGTVVEVANLFYNTPARKKFLKSETTERRHITTVVSEYAMAYPQVRFELMMNGREVFHSPGTGDLADVLVATLGLDIMREMVEVSPLPPHRPDLPAIAVYGFASVPNLTRSNRTQIVLFVNGRAISDQRLTYAVVQAYHTLIPAGRYPYAILLVTVPPYEVDVNVHPTKAEVRFRSPDAVFSAVQRAVRRAVIDQSQSPSLGQSSPRTTPYPVHSQTPPAQPDQLELDFEFQSPNRFGRGETLPIHHNAPNFTEEVAEDDTPDEATPYYPPYSPPRPSQPHHQDDAPTAIPDQMTLPKRPRTLPILRPVGQINATYIVAEGPAGMYLVDQHAAHERILFEQFLAQFQAQRIAVQHTLETSVVSLSVQQAQLLEEYQNLLVEMGFSVEPFGPTDFVIRTVPAILADRNPAEVLQLMIQDIESRNAPGALTIEEKILRRVCKAAAIKAGQTLTHQEMDHLLRQLERCENPHTCPHGRPTMIHLSTSQLEKEFGRM